MPLSSFYWGAQNWRQHSKLVSSVNAEWRGRITHLDLSANAFPNAVGLFCCEDALLTHAQLVLHQEPRVLLYRATFKLVSPQQVLVPKISHPKELHGILTVLSTKARKDHIFLTELDRCFDQNFPNIYRILTQTECLSIQPSHRSNETFSKHHGFSVDFGTCSNFWKTRWKGRRIILLPLSSPLVNFLHVSHTLSPGFCWMIAVLTYCTAAFKNGKQEILRWQWYLPLVRQSCLEKIKSYLLACKIFLRDTMSILKCVNPAFLGWDCWGLWQLPNEYSSARKKRERPELGPGPQWEVCTYIPGNWLQGWSLWHCMKQSEYTEIKGLVVTLILMQLHGFTLLWRRKIHKGRVIIDLVSYIWEQEEHTELAQICDALLVSWW